jgi:hypothetical protein
LIETISTSNYCLSSQLTKMVTVTFTLVTVSYAVTYVRNPPITYQIASLGHVDDDERPPRDNCRPTSIRVRVGAGSQLPFSFCTLENGAYLFEED